MSIYGIYLTRKGALLAMTSKLYETVKPIAPLPVWFYVFSKIASPTVIAPHWHQGIELSYVQSGKIDDFTIAGQHYHSSAGNIIVVNTQELHSISNSADAAGLALSIIFPYDLIMRYYPAFKNLRFAVPMVDQVPAEQQLAYANLQGKLTEFLFLQTTQHPLRDLRCTELSLEILTILLDHFTIKDDGHNLLRTQKPYVAIRLQEITQYIHEHYAEAIQLQDIADHVNLSKEYLARFFKQHLQLTVDRYLNNVRAQAANADLSSQHPLNQIALKHGFSGIRSMNRAFKAYYGKTASELRKEQVNLRQ